MRSRFSSSGNVRPRDDVDRPVAEWHERLLEFFARIAAIGEDVAQPREGASDRAQKRGGAVAILDIRRMDDRADQQSAGVGENVSVAALDLRAGVEAARTTRLGGLDRLAIDHPGRRTRLAPSHLARLHQQVMVNQFPPSIVPPLVEISSRAARDPAYPWRRCAAPRRRRESRRSRSGDPTSPPSPSPSDRGPSTAGRDRLPRDSGSRPMLADRRAVVEFDYRYRAPR